MQTSQQGLSEMGGITQETLVLLKDAARGAVQEELRKAWNAPASATTGINMYDLEGPAKKLYPVITPLRNSLPRVGGGMGTQANWKAITGININGLSAGVSDGNRGGVIATTVQDKNAVYRGIGLEDFVTFEAQYAGRGFDDVKALAVEGLLRSMMIQEERIILGGNSSIAFGTTPTPTLVASASGGSLATDGTFSVVCVALTLEGFLNSTIAGGVPAAIARTNADGSVDNYGGGSAQKSATATVSVTGPNGSVTGTVASVAGAVAYAWYWGAAGSILLGAITTINSVAITANATGTQTAASMPSSDNSRNLLLFDGFLTLIAAAGSNSYIKTLATGVAGTGTPLTSDTAGGIVEIDEALRSFWDNFRLSPTGIWVAAQEQLNITKKILAASSTAAQRFVFQVNQSMMAGGTLVTSYLNKFAMGGAIELPIRLHPNVPAGTILFDTRVLPYPLSNVTNVAQIRTRQDYYQLEWPMRSRKYEYGVYADEVLQNYFTPAFGVIRNIGNG